MKIRYATMIVNDMEESVKFYTETLDFTVDEVFDVPGGKITLLDGDGFAGIELIEKPFKPQDKTGSRASKKA